MYVTIPLHKDESVVSNLFLVYIVSSKHNILKQCGHKYLEIINRFDFK